LKLYTSINPKRCKHDIAVEYANCIDPEAVSVEISCVSNFYTVRSTCLKHTQMFILYVQIILNNRYGSYFLWQKIGSGGIRILWTHF